MSYEEKQRQQKPFQGMREGLSAAMACCRIINAPLQAMSRRTGTCGCHFFGARAAVALLAIPLICGFAAQPAQRQFFIAPPQGRHIDGVVIFLALYLLALLEHRCRYSRLDSSQKAAIHSRSGGVSVWTRVVRSERAARLFAEPIAWALCGLVLRDEKMYFVFDTYISVGALGSYLLVGAFALFFEATIDIQVDQARLRSLQDAHVENAYFAELHQRSRGRN